MDAKTAFRGAQVETGRCPSILREVMMKENSGVRFPTQPGRMNPQKHGGNPSRSAGRSPVSGENDREIAADLAEQIAEIPDVRVELVAKVGSQIEAGTYETPKKLDIAVAKMINEFIEESNV